MADSSISIRMLRLPDVMAITGLSRAAIYAKCNPKDKARFDPDFPQRVQLSANTVAWPSGWMRKDGKHNRIKLPRKAVELNLLCVKRMYCFVGDVPPDEAAEQI